jgi:hypothetical protein
MSRAETAAVNFIVVQVFFFEQFYEKRCRDARTQCLDCDVYDILGIQVLLLFIPKSDGFLVTNHRVVPSMQIISISKIPLS